MKTFILLALFVAMAMSAPSEDNQAAAHLRNKRSRFSNVLNNLMELAEREQAQAESNDLIDALAVMEEYGLLDNKEVAALQDYVEIQEGGLLGGLLEGWSKKLNYSYILLYSFRLMYELACML